MQVSREEMSLWLLTALRTTCVLIIGALNVNYMSYQTSSSIIVYIEIIVSILYLVCFAIMMIIVREAIKVSKWKIRVTRIFCSQTQPQNRKIDPPTYTHEQYASSDKNSESQSLLLTALV